MNTTGFVPLSPDECDAIDYLAAARWLPITALPAHITTALCHTRHATVADGYIRLTPQGWALYDICEDAS